MGSQSTLTFIQYLERFERILAKWGTITLAFIVALAISIFEVLHVMSLPSWGEKAILGVSMLIALGVGRQIFSIAKSSDLLMEKTMGFASELGELRREIDNKLISLADDLSPKLTSLGDCVAALKHEAEDIYPIENLKMDWLGLDMGHAWRYVVKSVLNNERIKKVSLRVLMISPEWPKGDPPPWLPAEVQEWSSNSAKVLVRINAWLDDELPQIRAAGREIQIEIKLYDRLPVVHGFRITEPFRTSYISFCRWEGAKYRSYDWGETKYRKISSDLATPASKDLADVFIGQFEHLWRTLESYELTALSRPKQVPGSAIGRASR